MNNVGMRILEKITLVIYSTLMLIVSIVLALIVFGWLDYNVLSELLHTAILSDRYSKIILALCVVFILLSIKCIFFSSSDKVEKPKQGILLANSNGKLMISQDTIENLVNSVANGFESAKDISTRVTLDRDNNVIVDVNLVVSPNAVIKELSTNLQVKIKETIKQASDLDVKEVNIKIKNIAPRTNEVKN